MYSPIQKTHIPYQGNKYPSDMCSPADEIHIPNDLSSPNHETHIPSDVFPYRKIHTPSDLFPYLGNTYPYWYVLQPGKHIPSDVFPYPRKTYT